MTQADSPKLVIIFGPPAVGKMTVGQELARIIGARLLYNHMVTDLVTALFPFGSPEFHRLARGFTFAFLEEAARARMRLVLTHGLIFSSPSARGLIDEFSAAYLSVGGAVCYAELTAPLECRLLRNETENRRRHKNVEWSTPEMLREMEGWGRWSSDGAFPYPDRHIVIDNSELAPADTAERIRTRFSL